MLGVRETREVKKLGALNLALTPTASSVLCFGGLYDSIQNSFRVIKDLRRRE